MRWGQVFTLYFILLSASPVFADVSHHKVKTGDTPEGLAKFYYGDEKKALYIINVNKLDAKKSLTPGKTLLVPFVTVHTVKKKGSFKDLASRYLKDPKKAGALAALNGMDVKEVLKPGLVVKVPFEIFYRAGAGDTLASIAEKFLGDQKEAVFLRDYNRLRDLKSIKAGKKLAIPLMVERAAPPQEKKEAPKTVDPAAYRKDLESSISLYEDGEYRESLDKLRAILLSVGEEKIRKRDRVTIHQYMAFNYVAIDEEEAAKGEFLELLRLAPAFRLDPKETSPKILSVFTSVKK